MSVVLVLDQLEQLAVELVAVTNAAIFDVGAGDLSLLQWRTLMVLGGSEEPLRVNELADRASASMPSASRLIRRMERRGLVSISRDPSDGRGRRIALTPGGEALRRNVIARRRGLIEDALAELAEEPGLVRGLESVVARLSRWQ
jgi:DNA-binding MarR family transcriptional regulator